MSVQFDWPFTAPTKSMALRNPIFGDSKTIVPKTQTRVAMDGSFYSFKSTPSLKQFNLTFEDLSRPQLLEFEDFLISAVGSEIRFIEDNGTNWRGYITSQPIQSTVEGTGQGQGDDRKERNSISIVFEGTQV